MYKPNYVSFLTLIAFCSIFAGCGDGTVQTSGTVRFTTGEPVPFGIVFFESPEFSYRGTIKDGTYNIEGLKRGSGLPPGTYNVYVMGDDPETELSLFDVKYVNPDTSGLVFKAEKGQKNVFDFEVEKSLVQRAPAPTRTPGP